MVCTKSIESKQLGELTTLKRIFEVKDLKVLLYLDCQGDLFWSFIGGKVLSIESLPKNIQIPFLIKCIHNHDLAERTKSIKKSTAWIELYVKAKFFNNEPLDI